MFLIEIIWFYQYLCQILQKPSEDEIDEFNHYLIDKYTVKEIIKLIT